MDCKVLILEEVDGEASSLGQSWEDCLWWTLLLLDFPGGSDGKSIWLQCWRPGFDPWVGKIPWRRKWQPTPVFLPGKYRGWRNLAGRSPWGGKESDTTEWLHCSYCAHRKLSLLYWPCRRGCWRQRSFTCLQGAAEYLKIARYQNNNSGMSRVFWAPYKFNEERNICLLGNSQEPLAALLQGHHGHRGPALRAGSGMAPGSSFSGLVCSEDLRKACLRL